MLLSDRHLGELVSEAVARVAEAKRTMAEQAVEQTVTQVYNYTTEIVPLQDKKVSGIAVGLVVGLPVLFIVCTVVVVLLVLLLWYRYRGSRGAFKPTGRYSYKSVPTDEADGNGAAKTNTALLPYPPSVDIADPPSPAMTFHMAAQLSTEPRYPFMEATTDSQGVLASPRKPPRAGKGGRPRRSPRRVSRLNSGSTTSSDAEDKAPRFAREKSPSIVSLSESPGLGEYNPHHMYALPSSKTVTASSGDELERLPEIFLVLIHDKDSLSLIVKIERVAGLPKRKDGSEMDTYVRLFIIPKLPELSQRRTSKTKTQRHDSAPIFDEEIRYDAMTTEELINSTLHVEVLDYRPYGKHHVIGQSDLPLASLRFDQIGVATVTLSLQPPKPRENMGTVLLSICYSPDSKKLSVIILRAKDLNKGKAKETDTQAKISVCVGDKIMTKLKTKKKPQSCSPIFNEALTCTVDPATLKSVVITVVMVNDSKLASQRELGQVGVSAQSSREAFRHWNDVMATPGKHIAEWHELR